MSELIRENLQQKQYNCLYNVMQAERISVAAASQFGSDFDHAGYAI